jgi:hypothetical protein
VSWEGQAGIFCFCDALFLSHVVHLALIIELVYYHVLHKRSAEFWVGLEAQHLVVDHPVLDSTTLWKSKDFCFGRKLWHMVLMSAQDYLLFQAGEKLLSE